jgi:hypothetical protein
VRERAADEDIRVADVRRRDGESQDVVVARRDAPSCTLQKLAGRYSVRFTQFCCVAFESTIRSGRPTVSTAF